VSENLNPSPLWRFYIVVNANISNTSTHDSHALMRLSYANFEWKNISDFSADGSHDLSILHNGNAVWKTFPKLLLLVTRFYELLL
jgi:hypothetical protein